MKRYCFTEQLQSMYEGLQQPFAIYQFINNRLVPIAISDGFCELFGYEDKAQAYYDMGNDMYKDVHPDDVARISDATFCFANEDGKYEVIYRTCIKNGNGYKIIHALGRHVYTEDGVCLAHVWYTDEGKYAEKTQFKKSELKRAMNNALLNESIVKANLFDYLTGLPSITCFFELAEAEKKAIMKKGGQPILLYTDFRGMKFFNVKHGFEQGNKVLQSFAKLLANVFENENCCRVGADHFVVITEETDLENNLNGIFSEFEKLYGEKKLPVHVGIYPYRIETVNFNSACDRAQLACILLKNVYSSAYRYYNAEMQEEALQKQYIIENIDTAIREKWIQVYLQPIIRTVNEKICDVEALARWIDPKKGFLSPAKFIPVLEESGLIYKLDLYMLEQVLESIKIQKAEGFSVIPHSINISRSDFDACDIVEEIRKRVDAAGVKRDKISIEITESIIGSDFEFMKEQVKRFQKLGFPVWMDDFGSGYSSFNVLQNIKFDLLKLDRSFLRNLDESEEGKVILTELIRLATSLGIDTVCEGVEKESQVQFLREVGCSKLQGYYYSKPESFETILKNIKSELLPENENLEESDYYETIGRVNLYDLGAVAQGCENSIQNTFVTLPMGIIEVKGDSTRFVRSNPSYRDFVKRFLGLKMSYSGTKFTKYYDDGFMNNVIKTCCKDGLRLFYEEKMPNGSIVHSLAQRLCANPVTGNVAIAVAVLSVTEPNEETSYADIARALATDYYSIYVIDIDTDNYIEYSSLVGGEKLALERHGTGFFELARRDTMTRIYKDDREMFLTRFSKENVIHDLDTQGVFTTTYRLIDTGTPIYVNMKITRMRGSNRIILGLSIIDAQMKQQEAEKRLRQEKASLERIAALAGNYIVLYTIDPVTDRYIQYNPSGEFESLGLEKHGEDFFTVVKIDAQKAIHPEDMERHLRIFTKENMMCEIQRNGLFIHNYRLLLNEQFVPVSLKATLIEEVDGERILLGIANDEREEYRRRLEEAYEEARNTSMIYTHIAQALARGYTDLYYVNMDTGALIEFHTNDDLGVLTEARRGMDFFESCKRDVKFFVHPEDQAAVVKTMNREFLTEALKQSKVYELTYRRIKDGRSLYVRMRISRVEEDKRYIVIAVSDIDELMRKRQAEERMMEERVIYARLHAITGNFICVYVVDPETGCYRELSATDDYVENFAQAKNGNDFFNTFREAAQNYSHPEDCSRVLSIIYKENIMAEIEQNGIFTLGYRIMMGGKPLHVQIKAAMVKEKEGPRLIVGLNDIDIQVRQEQEYGRRLAQAEAKANIDTLTGVKNKRAYLVVEEHINRQIENHRQSSFAVVIFDVNDLKKVNDTNGHQAGDQYLCEVCKIICDIFKRSPVFRVGGDEFEVIVQGNDYEHIEELLETMHAHNVEALRTGGIVIACGMAEFENDKCIASVVERADHNMYENKSRLKSGS